MGNLFSLNTILNENNMFSSIVKSPVTETYLNSSLSILEKFNSGITESTKTMYSHIAESTSRAGENEKFAEYFKTYKSLIGNYTREMQELVSKFAINISTYIDANQSTIDNADGMSVVGEPTIKVYDYQNLDNDKIPEIDIEKAFKKEFKFIGKMMQDLGNSITDDETKANVLATVCNNLAADIQDDWIEKCMAKIADIDDKDECKKTNFATMIYKKFNPGELRDMKITDGDIQQARLALMNASTLVDGIEKANEEFAAGLDNIANEIGAMFFRNQDLEMPIKTKEEGIADRNYKLSPSAFNQFNIFMANKCTQITELCNLYLIAISIKADSIYKYLKQCVDIIETAMAGVDNTPNDENIDDPSENGDTNSSDDFDDTDGDDIKVPDMDDNSSILGNNESKSDSSDNIDSKEDANEAEAELDEAAYLFEATVFELDRVYQSMEIQETAKLLTEADAMQKDTGISARISSIIDQLQKLIEKFITALTDSITPSVNVIKTQEYQNKVKSIEIPKDWTIDYVDTEKLAKVMHSDLNIKTDGALLDNTDEYFKTKWKDFIGDGKNIHDMLYNGIVTINKQYTAAERDAGIKYLLGYSDAVNKLKLEVDALKNEQRKVNTDIKSGHFGESVSSLEEAMVMYFTEADNLSNPADATTSDNTGNNTTQNQNSNNQPNNANQQNNNQTNTTNSNQQQNKSDDSAKKRAGNYFSVNSKVLAAKMSIMKQVASQHIKFLDHLFPIKANNQQSNNDQNK